MKKLLALILLVMLVATSITVMAANGYPTIYERDTPFRYCSLLENGYSLSLETEGTEWTTIKSKNSYCLP